MRILRLCSFKKLTIAFKYEYSEIRRFSHNLIHTKFPHLVLSKYPELCSYRIKALELSKFI